MKIVKPEIIFVFIKTVFLFFIMNACEKITNKTWIFYDETGCSDPWGAFNMDESEKIKKIEDFLKERNVLVFEIKIVNDGTIDTCFACHCKTGRRVHSKIKDKHKEIAFAEGFYE